MPLPVCGLYALANTHEVLGRDRDSHLADDKFVYNKKPQVCGFGNMACLLNTLKQGKHESNVGMLVPI